MARNETLDLETEIYNLTQVRRDCVTGYYSIIFPGYRDIEVLFRTLGVRAPVPDNSDPIYKRIQSRVKANWSFWTAWADSQSTYGRIPPAMAKTAPQSTNDNTKAGDEARVKQMDGRTALKFCSKMEITVEPHPTNPGITAMRAKNALAHKVRQGERLPAAA